MSTKKAANQAANESECKSTEKTVTAPKKKPEIMRDFNILVDDDGDKENPSTLAGDYSVSIRDGKTLQEYLSGFDFKSEADIAQAIKRLVYAVATDPYLSVKSNRDGNPFDAIAYNLAAYMKKPGELKNIIDSIASEVWLTIFLPKQREKRLKKMFSMPIDRDKFDAAFLRIMQVFGFDYLCMYRIQLFVLQCKMRDNFPVSQQRVLFFHGAYLTGKSTTAMILAALLNGTLVTSEDYRLKSFKKEIAFACGNELGFPKIASYNCVTADEVFVKNGRNNEIYQNFKSVVTSKGGTSRNPYGQWVSWRGRANYILTSNYPLQDFIQDYRDRRFLEVPFKVMPEQMSETELMLLWYDFVVNAEPRKYGEVMPTTLEEFIKFVGDKSNVLGDFADGVSAIKLAMTSQLFIDRLESLNLPYCSINSIMSIVQEIEPSFKTDRDIPKTLFKTAAIELFGERDDKHRWHKTKMLEVLKELIEPTD